MSKWESYFMEVAMRTAELSYATRLKVGAVAVVDKRIVCCGYNGTPPGTDNRCEREDFMPSGAVDIENYPYFIFDAHGKQMNYRMVTKDEVSHAEENLITFAAKNGICLKGATLYITHAPCIHCAKLINNSGITEVIYGKTYRADNGVNFLKQLGIEIRQYGKEN